MVALEIKFPSVFGCGSFSVCFMLGGHTFSQNFLQVKKQSRNFGWLYFHPLVWSAHCRTKMKVLMNVMKNEMDEIIIIMLLLLLLLLYPLEFPRSQWLLLLEWGPFRCGDFVEIRRSRHTIDDSRHWRRILSGNGQIGMGTQSSTSTIGLRHRSCRYVVNIFIYLFIIWLYLFMGGLFGYHHILSIRVRKLMWISTVMAHLLMSVIWNGNFMFYQKESGRLFK